VKVRPRILFRLEPTLSCGSNTRVALPHPAVVSGTSLKMLLLLHKRLRQLLRATLVLAIHLAVAAAALAIWWPRSQNGLPDIGGPLDVEASRALRIADDQTAFLGTDVQTEKHKQQLLAAEGWPKRHAPIDSNTPEPTG
jgi:hypothetical protein